MGLRRGREANTLRYMAILGLFVEKGRSLVARRVVEANRQSEGDIVVTGDKRMRSRNRAFLYYT